MPNSNASSERSTHGLSASPPECSPSSTTCHPRFSLRQVIIVAIVMITSLGGYLLVLKWRGEDAVFITKTSLDDVIPFQPAWVWVYLIPYAIGPLVIGFLRRPTFNWYISRGIAVVAVTLLIFIMVPTQTASRPPHNLGTGLTGQLYQNMIAIDEPPANAAPSLHVSLTFLLGLALLMDFPRWWWLSTIGVVLVWLATLFTRQHHLIDVGTGILVAACVIAFWPQRKVNPS